MLQGLKQRLEESEKTAKQAQEKATAAEQKANVATEKAKAAEKQGGGNKDDQDIHFKRMAFRVTAIDEPDMAMAAISGVTRPNIARGTANIL